MKTRTLGIAVSMCAALSLALTGCGGKSKNEGDGQTDADDDADDATGDTGADVPVDLPEEEAAACTDDGDCDNGVFCDGEETCGDSGTCEAGTPPDCDDSDPCTTDACDDGEDECTHEPLDADGDGAPAEEGPGGETCPGTDCDDSNPDVYPGATEGCDLLDLDCDGDATEFVDDDHDGWIDEACDDEMTDSGDFDGFGDCDDEDDTRYPGAPEGCDGTIDHDCDGDATEIDSDADGDGWAPASCDPPGDPDCDDSDPDSYPGAPEICDMVDNDCDGSWADGGADDDADDFLDADCGGDDCDDTNELFNPGAVVLCTSQDRDCNGNPDNDQDGDGSLRGTAVSGWPVCDADQDCDDTDPAVFPGATPGCTTLDVNCNGNDDQDDDGDGYVRVACGGDDCDDGDPDVNPGESPTCTAADADCNGFPDEDNDDDGYVRVACGGVDCDDEDAAVHPGATPGCTTLDVNCNGEADQDDDGDGYVREACGGDDCDDDDADTHPGAPIACTTDDRDCNGNEDQDNDGDGHVNGNASTGLDCGGDDCDDADDQVHPGAAEICDTVDQDCDGDVLDAPGADDDGDGFLDETCGGDDCNDGNDHFHPTPPPAGASVCMDMDFDCDTIDDGPGPRITSEIKSGGNSTPSVAWNGSRWGVAYTTTNGTPGSVMLAVIDDDGNFELSPTPISDDNTVEHTQPDIAWSAASSRWGVVWRWNDMAGTIKPKFRAVEVLSGSTMMYPPTEATVAPSTWEDVWGPKIASTGTHFGVVWTGHDTMPSTYQVQFGMFDPDGSWVSGTNIADTSPTIDYEPDIAWHTSAFGIAFARQGTTKTDIWYDIVTPGTPPVDITEIRLTDVTVSQAAHNPAIAAGDVDIDATGLVQDGFFVVWEVADMSPASNIMQGSFSLDPGSSVPRSTTFFPLTSSGAAHAPAVAWNGLYYGVTWHDDRAGGQPDVYFLSVEDDGNNAWDEVQITTVTTERDEEPAIAANTQDFGIVWTHLGSAVWWAHGSCWW